METRIRLTDAQFAVLDVLWRSGPQRIRQIMETLYPKQTTSEYATVQKLLDQLEEKGCVRRDRSTPAHVFHPVVDRGDLIGAQLEEIAGKLGDGSLTQVLVHLVAGANLSAQDRDKLREMLAEPEKAKKRARSRRV